MNDDVVGGSALREAVLEVERHVADGGWDQPGRLFALVTTADLVAAEPDLAKQLGTHEHAAAPDALTPVEQEVDVGVGGLEQLLPTIAWPASVAGVLAVLERVVLPQSAEADLPDDPAEAERFAAEHPQRADVRLAAGVLRTGESHCVIRLRSRDSDEDLLHGAELVPSLVLALRETLEADASDVVRPVPGRAADDGEQEEPRGTAEVGTG